MKKVGVIRCRQTEDICPATNCLKAAAAGKSAFEQSGGCEVVGIVTCGGCPGKSAVWRASTLVERGAEVIALASCILKGAPFGFACPHGEEIKAGVIKRVGKDIEVLGFTH